MKKGTNSTQTRNKMSVPSATLSTLPDVFIIESLDRDMNGGVQGRSLATALSAFNRYPRYVDVSGKMEFLRALESFKSAGYRYLHVSCHGNIPEDGLVLRNGEKLSFKTLIAWISKLHLPQTRLFISACGVGSKDQLANGLFSGRQTRAVHSVLAPGEDIDLIEALVFWVAFYGEMYMIDKSSMRDDDIVKIAQRATNCCGRKFSYYSYVPQTNEIKHWSIVPTEIEPVSCVAYPL